MIGRMSSLQFNQGSLNVILEAQARLQRTQEQLAAGTDILTPSDDPLSSARILTIQSELSRIEQYQRNADTANAELRTIESTLANVEQVVMRVQELALRGNNGTLNDHDKRVIALEVSGLREQLVAISRTQNESGEFVFSGSRTDTAPYEEVDGELQFVGDGLVRSVNLGSTITLETRVDAESVFGASGAVDQSLFKTFDLLGDALSDSELPNAQFATAMASALNSLSTGLERVTSERAAVGLKMNRVDDQISLNDSFLSIL